MTKQQIHDNYTFQPPHVKSTPSQISSSHTTTPNVSAYVTTSGSSNISGRHRIVTQTTNARKRGDPYGLRAAIPQLPMTLAIVLCIINCILPGFGTMFAGFSVLCCSESRQSEFGRCEILCINFWVGFAQLLSTLFIMIGWIWSIMWGVAFIAIAAESHRKTEAITTISKSATVPVPTPWTMPQTTYSTEQSFHYTKFAS